MNPYDPFSQTGVACRGFRCPGTGYTECGGVYNLSPVTGKTKIFFINLHHKHWVLIVFGSLARQRGDGMIVVMIKYKFMIQELLIRSLSIRRHACHHLFLFSLLSTKALVACVDALRQITHVFYFLAHGCCLNDKRNAKPTYFPTRGLCWKCTDLEAGHKYTLKIKENCRYSFKGTREHI